MVMMTYKFIIRKGGKLVLRLRNNREKTELSLHEEMSEDELVLVLGDIASKRVNGRIRMKIANYIAILKTISNTLKDEGKTGMDVRRIMDMFAERAGIGERGEKGEFVYWFEKFLATKTNEGTRGIYRQTLNKIRQLVNDADYLKFSQINVGWLEDFESKCAKTASKNARNIHLRNIRAVFNYALMHDLDIPYPFRKFKVTPEKTRKRSLRVEDLRELFDYPVEPYAEIYRDMFKLIFLLVGINAVDLYNLKEVRDGRIDYKRAKTGGLYSIKVEPEAMEIIEKYRGKNRLLMLADRWTDHRNFIHQCNLALQKIGAERSGRGGQKGEGKWPGLSTYWARHSWATIARRLRIPIDDIALALGHSSGHDVTRIYIDEDQEVVDQANRRVIDWVLYGKGVADTPAPEVKL